MRLLVLPHYSEPLKALWPAVQAARGRGHEVTVVNLVRLPEDRDRAAGLLEAWGEPANFVDVDAARLGARIPRGHPLRERAGDSETNRWQQARERAVMRTLAHELLDAHRPDAVLLANEHMELPARLLVEAAARGIPAVCFQWTIANSSVRHSQEMLDRHELRPVEAGPPSNAAVPLKQRVGATAYAAVRRFRPPGPPRIDQPTPYFGGGHATRLAVIGEGSKRVYADLGTDPGKVVVTGHPLYEQLLAEARARDLAAPAPDALPRVDTAARAALNLPPAPANPVLLWCTNDQRTYYRQHHTHEQMVGHWSAIRDRLLATDPSLHLALKLHPKETLDDYRGVFEGRPRVHVIGDVPVQDVIPACELFLTRFSSTAVSAICLDRGVVTLNIPKVPGGTLYEDTGGTRHANTLDELSDAVAGLLHDPDARANASADRATFVRDYIDVTDRRAADRLVDLLASLAEDRAH